ncbi:MAG: hypothetical protein ACOY5F_18915 [Pseudomonadota bacterium]
MTVAVRPDILSCLLSMRQDVEQRIATLDRFRAVKALEQTIADFPGLDDLIRSLSDIRDRVRAELDNTREFRALRSIERIIPELSEVLALMDDAPAGGDRPADAAPVDAAKAQSEPGPGMPERAGSAETGPDVSGFEMAAFDAADTSSAMAEPEPGAPCMADASPSGRQESSETQDRTSRSDAMPPGPNAGPTPSLADSVAQLMASMSPQREGQVLPAPHPPERGDAPLTPAERAA